MYRLELYFNKFKVILEMQQENLYQTQKTLLFENYFASTTQTEEIITIRYTVDEKLYKKFKTVLSKQDTTSLYTFKYETHIEGKYHRHRLYMKSDGDYFMLCKDNNEYLLIGNPEVDTSIYPVRIIRELLLRKMEDAGYISCHGTGFVYEGKGFLLLNSSNSGKTTLMSKVFDGSHNKQIGLLSNDRVYCSNDMNVPMMNYCGFEINYEQGTVKNSAYMKKFFGNKYLNEYFENKNKISVNLNDMPKIYDNLQLIDIHKIDYLILPKIILQDEKSDNVVNKVDAAKCKQIIKENIFTPFDRESPRNPWFCRRKQNYDLNVQAQKALNYLMEIPIYSFEFNKNATPNEIVNDIERIIKGE